MDSIRRNCVANRVHARKMARQPAMRTTRDDHLSSSGVGGNCWPLLGFPLLLKRQGCLSHVRPRRNLFLRCRTSLTAYRRGFGAVGGHVNNGLFKVSGLHDSRSKSSGYCLILDLIAVYIEASDAAQARLRRGLLPSMSAGIRLSN